MMYVDLPEMIPVRQFPTKWFSDVISHMEKEQLFRMPHL